MKKLPYPYPSKVLKTEGAVENYIGSLVSNALSWMRIDGYTFFVLMPGADQWVEDKEAGMSIKVKYPYKSFYVSVQVSTVKNILNAPRDYFGFPNTEKLVFHEVIHILFWHLSELAQRRYVTPTDIIDAEESAVDHLSNVIIGLIRDMRKGKRV